MQEFEDLKTDIANLISATSQTVNALVTAAQSRVAVAAASSPPADVATYASQMTQLSSQIKSAMSSMQASAAVILGVPPASAPTPNTASQTTGQSGGAVPLGSGSAVSGSTSPQSSAPTSSAPSPASTSTSGGSDIGTTVGPDSFKAAN